MGIATVNMMLCEANLCIPFRVFSGDHRHNAPLVISSSNYIVPPLSCRMRRT